MADTPRREVCFGNLEIFHHYFERASHLAESRGGERDDAVMESLTVLSPRELDVVYSLAYDMRSKTQTARHLSLAVSSVQTYWDSALRKLKLALEPSPNHIVVSRINDAISRVLD